MSTRAAVTAAVEEAIAQGIFAGAVLLAGDAGQMRFHEAYGSSWLVPTRLAMQKDARFDVASLTKVVATSTAAAICMQEGLLHPRNPVRKFLPQFDSAGTENITLEQLATHTAGLGTAPFPGLRGEALVAAIFAAPLASPPGHRFDYTCRGFILLGLIVEKVTGQKLDQFCRDWIFGPLGMTDTVFGPVWPDHRSVGSATEAGWIEDEQARAIGRPVGNAGVFSTALDLSRFAEMMLGQGMRAGVRVLSQETWTQTTKCLTARGLPRRGFGWDKRPTNEVPSRPEGLTDQSFGHTGWTGQSFWIDPIRNRYLVMLTNRTHPDRHDEQPESHKRALGRIGELVLATLE